MSEYSFVEKPFLDQLDALDWTVLPDFSERKEWLRVHGAGMDL